MSQKPLQVCNEPGCNQLARAYRCEQHSRESNRSKSARRATGHEKAYNYKWGKASKKYRKHNPLCVSCQLSGRTSAASCVDHIIPHRGSDDLFWDKGNWCSLCWRCHSAKTRREDSLSTWKPRERMLVICGLPATGKTTLARKLASDWNCNVWDWDDVARNARREDSDHCRTIDTFCPNVRQHDPRIASASASANTCQAMSSVYKSNEAESASASANTKGWTRAEWLAFERERNRWIASNRDASAAVAIVSRPEAAMEVASRLVGRVRHLACNETTRLRRVAQRACESV